MEPNDSSKSEPLIKEDVEEGQISQQSEDHDSNNNIVQDISSDVGSSAHEDLYQEMIQQFCGITGAEKTAAITFLEAFGWDISTAIPEYFGQDGHHFDSVNNNFQTPRTILRQFQRTYQPNLSKAPIKPKSVRDKSSSKLKDHIKKASASNQILDLNENLDVVKETYKDVFSGNSEDKLKIMTSELVEDDDFEALNASIKFSVLPPNQTSEINQEDVMDVSSNQASNQTIVINGDTAPVLHSSANELIDDDHEKILKDFLDFSGAPVATARTYLEAFGWDMQTALQIYLGQESPPPVRSTGTATIFGTRVKPKVTHAKSKKSNKSNKTKAIIEDEGTPMTLSSADSINETGLTSGEENKKIVKAEERDVIEVTVGAEDVVNPVDVEDDVDVDDDDEEDEEEDDVAMPSIFSNIFGLMSEVNMGEVTSHDRITSEILRHFDNRRIRGFGNFNPYEEMDGNDEPDPRPYGLKKVDSYDAEGIRKPDPIKQTKLIRHSTYEDYEDEILGRADHHSVEWLFEPPGKIVYTGSLDRARQEAIAESKWILVNIQNHNDFTSNLLNRDLWTNESIEQIIRQSYLFWQRGHTSKDGMKFMQFHKLEEGDLPFIGIIDPRTGAKRSILTGYFLPEELSSKLIEFCESNTLTGPVLLPSTGTTSSSTITSSTMVPANERDRPDIPTNDGEVHAMETTAMLQEEIIPEKDQFPFGNIPDEPDEAIRDGKEAGKISIKLTNGKTIVRWYRRDELVRSLFAVAFEYVKELKRSEDSFDLLTNYPMRSLRSLLDKPIAENNLFGSQVILRLI